MEPQTEKELCLLGWSRLLKGFPKADSHAELRSSLVSVGRAACLPGPRGARRNLGPGDKGGGSWRLEVRSSWSPVPLHSWLCDEEESRNLKSRQRPLGF